MTRSRPGRPARAAGLRARGGVNARCWPTGRPARPDHRCARRPARPADRCPPSRAGAAPGWSHRATRPAPARPASGHLPLTASAWPGTAAAAAPGAVRPREPGPRQLPGPETAASAGPLPRRPGAGPGAGPASRRLPPAGGHPEPGARPATGHGYGQDPGATWSMAPVPARRTGSRQRRERLFPAGPLLHRPPGAAGLLATGQRCRAGRLPSG